jgi:hypothetical protein
MAPRTCRSTAGYQHSQRPKDPLFFMLHSNVDRLWALWQWINRRTDAGSADTLHGTEYRRPAAR